MNYHIYRIYRELMKRGLTFESIRNDRYPRHKIIDQMGSLFEGWQYNVDELIDVRNWKSDKLILDEPEKFRRGNIYYESRIRKPKAYFDLSFTRKENLVLDWYPGNPYNPLSPKPSDESDWLHWDNAWSPGSHTLPFNRVFMIGDFDRIMVSLQEGSYDRIDQYIAEAVRKLINEVYVFLNRFIEIEKITDLYIEYADARRLDKIIDCRIRNVKEAEVEKMLTLDKKWIEDTCKKFGITPKKFLKEFKKNGLKYAPTCRKISTKSSKMTSNKAKKLVRELYHFPEIYDSVLEQAPPGIEPRDKGGEVINVKFKQ
jgi:hypothetical protein